MSDSEDIFAENSDNSLDYVPDESIPSIGNVSISETDEEQEDEQDSADREMIERMKKRQSRRMSFHPKRESSSSSSEGSDVEVSLASDGDTTDDERFTDGRALSPSTRMSITGIRPEDLSSEDEEVQGVDDDDDVVVVKKKPTRRIISDDESEEESSEKSFKSSVNEVHKAQSTAESIAEDDDRAEDHDSFDDSLPMKSFNPESETKRESISNKLSSTANSDDIKEQNADISAIGRLSTSIRQSIGEKLSSTVVEDKDESIEFVDKPDEILLLSSDDDDDNKTAEPEIAPIKKKKPLVQPTIKSALINAKTTVSQSVYSDKTSKLSNLKSSLSTLESLLLIKSKLPDKGVHLSKKMEALKSEIGSLEKEISLLEVSSSSGIRDQIQKSFETSLDSVNTTKNSSTISETNKKPEVINISWDDIKKAAEDVQPKHFGTQGMATFQNQKTLTMGTLATLHKSIETCPSEDTLCDPPKLLKIELMQHQRYGLSWMLWRESQKPRGGILADDMGLGKTLSMIALILKSAELEDPDKEPEHSDSEDDEAGGNDGWKAKGRRDYYPGGTIIVCPASLMRQWESEINTRVARNSLAVSVYHGSNRDVKPRHLAKYDVVITTYNIASREAKGDRVGVFGVNWERIILDEAHMIRNHKSAMSVACCQLKGRYRWALTGTPIQNKEMDMYALLKFLRCTPFDDLSHWKKWIDNKSAGGMQRLNTIMKSILLRRTKKQLQEKGTLQCLPEKNIEVVEIKLQKEEMNVYQKVMMYSRTLFAQFLHQRVEKENDTYFGSQSQRPTFAQTRQPNGAFDRVHQKLKRMHVKDEVKQHQILVLLLRLRQICCHPGLIHQMLEDDDGNFDVSTVEDQSSELDILEELEKMKLTDTSGNGNDSRGVLREINNSHELPDDHVQAISKASSKVMLRSNPVFNLERCSSKLNQMLKLLDEKILQGDDKAVIVSQWSSVLEIVERHLQEKRIRYVMLTGKVAVKFRNDLVNEFNKVGAGPRIMLLSLTAGGVGLNLVGANHLLLLDLHWNPQLEAQAQDRVYRVGQKKTVYIWKFMCVDTVEQSIRALQQRKLDIADGVLTGGGTHSGSKLTIDDLKSLFGFE
ncbi:transcription termination factor 2 [Uranotaenia lowii]|uniref:transcription termination factor 2 n=1 Tax=Uranotaenia lowii TaxID=190385 RepID=UPI002478D527|nr:transcription termination factor 2 [Uranotaenia lowii]